MKKFKVSRAYVTRMEWIIEAKNAKDAEAAMSDDERTPIDEADENWLGPVYSVAASDVVDQCEEL